MFKKYIRILRKREKQMVKVFPWCENFFDLAFFKELILFLQDGENDLVEKVVDYMERLEEYCFYSAFLSVIRKMKSPELNKFTVKRAINSIVGKNKKEVDSDFYKVGEYIRRFKRYKDLLEEYDNRLTRGLAWCDNVGDLAFFNGLILFLQTNKSSLVERIKSYITKVGEQRFFIEYMFVIRKINSPSVDCSTVRCVLAKILSQVTSKY